MKVINMSQDNQAWLDWRKDGIGASDVATILGVNPYKTRYELWAEKTGLVDAPDLSGNFNVQRGNRLEPLVRVMIEHQLGETLEVFCAEHDERSEIRCSFDGVDSTGMPHEIKCPSDGLFADVEIFGADSEPYKMYRNQVVYQCLIEGVDTGMLHFYSETKDELVSLKVELKESDSAILEIVSDFWEMIQNKEAPERDMTRDKANENDVNTLLLEKLIASKKHLIALETELKSDKAEHVLLEKELITQLGDFDKFESAAFGVKATQFETRAAIDYAKFCKDHGINNNKLEAYRKASRDSVKFTYDVK